MKIVVFGGSGFLGSHLCDKLSDAGHQVTIYDRVSSQWLRSDQTMVIGNILDEHAVAEVVTGQDVVYNFSGLADLDDALSRPIDSVRLNILGNTIILEACRQANIQRYIFSSSMYVYSRSGGFYRCSKQACELYIENYYQSFGLKYTILRFGSLYGPRSNDKNAIYRYIRQALTEKRITYKGSSDAVREYIHVEDAARASVKVLDSQFENEHIILTGDQRMKVKEMLQMIAEILGIPLEIDVQHPHDQAHYHITPYSFNPKMGKKLFSELNVDLGQGLLRVIEELHESLESAN